MKISKSIRRKGKRSEKGQKMLRNARKKFFESSDKKKSGWQKFVITACYIRINPGTSVVGPHKLSGW